MNEVARQDIDALAQGGRTNVSGFVLRLIARLPFLFIAGRIYGAELVGRFALAVVVVELAALLATLGLKRGLAKALAANDRPAAEIVWDKLAASLLAALFASGLLLLFPQVMYPSGSPTGAEWWLPMIVFAGAMSDVSLAALAYRRNVKATVTARAVIEPWTISIGAWLFSYVSLHDGLILAYMASMLAALAASLVPFIRSYGLPRRWRPHPGRLAALMLRNLPLAGADAIEWATRNVDRFILGVLFEPKVVGIYYMAQQIASLPSKLKTSFDPILGPVITESLARNDYKAIAQQVRQVAFWIIAAQACLALIGTILGEAVMGLVGPQFVVHTAALSFLLTAELAASTGAVCESVLVYVARHLNLTISVVMLTVQIVLSFVFILFMQGMGWSTSHQAAGPAAALLLSVALSSLVKGGLLSRILKARVSPLRWSMLVAVMITIAVGFAFTALPHRLEWVQLVIGLPVIFGVYWFLMWRWVFRPEDRALFSSFPKADEAALPAE